MKKNRIPQTISLEYLLNEVRKQEQQDKKKAKENFKKYF